MAKMLRYKGKLYKEVESRKVFVDSARPRLRRRFVDAEENIKALWDKIYNDVIYSVISDELEYTLDYYENIDFLNKKFKPKLTDNDSHNFEMIYEYLKNEVKKSVSKNGRGMDYDAVEVCVRNEAKGDPQITEKETREYFETHLAEKALRDLLKDDRIKAAISNLAAEIAGVEF